jgi:hypothetical protein
MGGEGNIGFAVKSHDVRDDPVEISRPEEQGKIARTKQFDQQFGDGFEGLAVVNAGVMRRNFLGHLFAAEAIGIRLSGGVDIGDDRDVGIAKRLSEIREKGAGATGTVGLEDGNQPTAIAILALSIHPQASGG